MYLRNGKTVSKKPKTTSSEPRDSPRDLKRKTSASESAIKNTKIHDRLGNKRARLDSFIDIGEFIASIPSYPIRKNIFSRFTNTTRLNLLPLFNNKKHHKFLLSCPETWKRMTLNTDELFFKNLIIIKTHLSEFCDQIRLNANVYHSEYLDFLEDYKRIKYGEDLKHGLKHGEGENRELIAFLEKVAVSFDNYDCMFMDKLDDIHDETVDHLGFTEMTDDEFNAAREFNEKDLKWFAERSFNSKIREIGRNCKPGYPAEIVESYQLEIKQDRLAILKNKFRDYSVPSKLVLSKQMKIWRNVGEVEEYALRNRLFQDLNMFQFKNLKALHIWGGFLRDEHGAGLSELENLSKLSIFSEYTMCPDFQRDRYDCYTHSLLEITDTFFEPFIVKNKQNLRYLEFADWCPVEDYEIRDVWDHNDLSRFQHLLDQVNVRKTFFSAETLKNFIISAMSPEADAVHLYLNPIVLSKEVINGLLQHCTVLKELSIKHCVDHDEYFEMPNEVISANLSAFSQLESLLLKNMYFDTRSIFNQESLADDFKNLSFLKYTCSFNDQRYLEGILFDLRKRHAQENVEKMKTQVRGGGEFRSQAQAHSLKISRSRENFDFRPHRPHWQNFYHCDMK